MFEIRNKKLICIFNNSDASCRVFVERISNTLLYSQSNTVKATTSFLADCRSFLGLNKLYEIDRPRMMQRRENTHETIDEEQKKKSHIKLTGRNDRSRRPREHATAALSKRYGAMPITSLARVNGGRGRNFCAISCMHPATNERTSAHHQGWQCQVRA